MRDRTDCNRNDLRDVPTLTRRFYGQNRNGEILVIEDDPETAELLRVCLEFEGYRVCVAENRDDARLNLRMATFHCIIMDVYMTGLDLGTFLEREKTCPVILISAGYNIEETAKRHGINLWLKKQDIADELLNMLDELL